MTIPDEINMSLLLAALVGEGRTLSLVRAMKDGAAPKCIAEGSILKLTPKLMLLLMGQEAKLRLQIARRDFVLETRCTWQPSDKVRSLEGYLKH